MHSVAKVPFFVQKYKFLKSLKNCQFLFYCQNWLFYIYSVNQVRIRDVVEQDESMFEIHKLENIHVVSGINPYSSEYFIQTFM
mgnify:CR=1 FL=1